MHELQNEPPEGIRVQLNGADISDIQAYIDGPGKIADRNYFNAVKTLTLLMKQML